MVGRAGADDFLYYDDGILCAAVLCVESHFSGDCISCGAVLADMDQRGHTHCVVPVPAE